MSEEIVKYSIPAPNGMVYSITGPAGASEDEVKAEVLRQHPEAGEVPTSQSGDNVINQDVPTVVGARRNAPQPVPETRSMADVGKAAYEVPLSMASSLLATPISGAYGVYKGVTGGNYGTDKGTQEGAQAANELYQKLQYEPSSLVTGDVLGKVGEVADALKLPPMPTSGGTLPTYASILRKSTPLMRQTAGNTANAVRSIGENGLPSGQDIAKVLRKKDIPNMKKASPTSEFLDAESTKYFDLAKKEGIEIDRNIFNQKVQQIKNELRQLGYDADAMPKVGVAIKQLEDMQTPKDYQELRTLRRFIGNAQRSREGDEVMVATQLKHDFDDLISNMPDEAIVGGSKKGIEYWKKARESYNRLAKSEIFENMLERAPLHATRYSQSGEENFLAGELRKLADNPKQMRQFTPEEQKYIREAAIGGNMQNALRLIGKYNPSGVIAQAAGAGLGAYFAGPVGAAAVPTAGWAAHQGAAAIRKNDVKKLGAIMRANAKNKDGE